MKDPNASKGEKGIRFAAVLMICLLIVSYISTIYNLHTISAQVNMISTHPFPVSKAAGEVNVYAARLRAQAERLEYSFAPERVSLVEKEYEDIDKNMETLLVLVKERYLTDAAEGQKLQERYESLSGKQKELIELCRRPGVKSRDINRFIALEIFPAIEMLEKSADSILEGSSIKFDEFQKKAETVFFSSLTLSTLLTLSVLITMALYQKVLADKRKYEDRLRLSLQDALRTAQNANEAKSRFLSNMSHDIRTPLNAVVGMTAIAGTHLDDSRRVKECLEKITVASGHLLGLINDVLDMSKIESGKILLEREAFSLPQFCRNFIAMLSPQAKAGQLEMDLVVGNVSREMVIGDSLRLNQILLNIAGNALKFTPAGGRIRIGISEQYSDSSTYGKYCFTIEDNGVGMSKEFQEILFQPFERERTSTISRTEGTGLGMAITKNLVDMMGGSISVESEQGKGSRFTVLLPLEWEKTQEEECRIDALKELRALVVDDDPAVCENTVRLLDEIGMDGSSAETGEEAVVVTLEAHQEGKDFHTIIMDWKLPGIDGIEAARQIRSKLGPDLPIILLTAYDWSELEQEAREAGITAFLTKPLFKSNLYQTLREVTEDVSQDTAQEQERKWNALTAAEKMEKKLQGKVLIAEDNAINMEIAVELLKQAGAASDQAWDGRQAADMILNAPENTYRLVLMDIQMPVLDGYGAAEEIRRFEKETGRSPVPIVAMTANAFREDREKARAAGMDGYVTKPVDIMELTEVLQKYLS